MSLQRVAGPGPTLSTHHSGSAALLEPSSAGKSAPAGVSVRAAGLRAAPPPRLIGVALSPVDGQGSTGQAARVLQTRYVSWVWKTPRTRRAGGGLSP